jgi:alpha-ketoglutaric semialdehyde dehydrogenase
MSLHSVLVAGAWRAAVRPTGSFAAVNPATREPIDGLYPVSSLDEVNEACEAGRSASVALRSLTDRADRIAVFLEDYASRIDSAADALCDVARLETAYPITPRLKAVELPRTVNQLRQAAAAARGRSWTHATIDPKAGIRSYYTALGGPVVVFGPNNFPFAFNSIAGGDFVAAIAAGNPVIGKANTGHPGTSKALAELAFAASQAAGLPPAMVQLLYRTPPEVGLALVSHAAVVATGFTGSKDAGLKLKAAADAAGKPIYLEMASVNPIFVLPRAIDERFAAIAKELFDSCALGAGQFCTRPGLTIVPAGPTGEGFVEAVAGHFKAASPGTLLGASGLGGIEHGLAELQRAGATVVVGGARVTGPNFAFEPTLLRVAGDTFLEHPHALQTEAFGTVNMIVVARDVAQMVAIADSLEGNLTGCIYSDTTGRDDDEYRRLEPVVRQRVGRLLNDKMPTGVAVSPAMNHGGPFPATGHPGFTAVGIPASLLRFAALQSFDAVRPHRLPPELQDKNPTGAMWRSIDGEWTQGDVG